MRFRFWKGIRLIENWKRPNLRWKCGVRWVSWDQDFLQELYRRVETQIFWILEALLAPQGGSELKNLLTSYMDGPQAKHEPKRLAQKTNYKDPLQAQVGFGAENSLQEPITMVAEGMKIWLGYHKIHLKDHNCWSGREIITSKSNSKYVLC